MKKFNPRCKSFKQRLDAFKRHALKNYKVPINSTERRTREKQQRWHIAHMFLYNNFKCKPANCYRSKPHTITWEHFSDPSVKWTLIQWSDFLRDKKNKVPKKTRLGFGDEWKEGCEPHEGNTRKNIRSILTKVGNGGTAKVAAGTDPCGEPCCCKSTVSKHVTGMASDVNTSDLNILERKLQNKNMNSYLTEFGLHRRVEGEAWHVEAIPDKNEIQYCKKPEKIDVQLEFSHWDIK